MFLLNYFPKYRQVLLSQIDSGNKAPTFLMWEKVKPVLGKVARWRGVSSVYLSPASGCSREETTLR